MKKLETLSKESEDINEKFQNWKLQWLQKSQRMGSRAE